MDSEWQADLISMKKRNAHILKTGLRSDCCFLVGVIPENQRLFEAHKFLLSNASPVFERMFYGSLREKDNQPIEILDIDADDFYDLLCFIYTEEIAFVSVDKAQQLYYVGSKYMMKQLMMKCIEFLRAHVTADNVCSVFEFAKQFEEQNLYETCMRFIKEKTSAVLLSPSLLLANISTLDAILSQDKLNIEDEIELFTALERYADFRFSIDKRSYSICSICKNRTFTPESAAFKNKQVVVDGEEVTDQDSEDGDDTVEKVECLEEEKKKNVKGASRQKIDDTANFLDLLKKIRFLTMSAENFACGPALSKLLSKSDALDILICLEEPANVGKHFPHGFSDSKLKRYVNPSTNQQHR